VTILLLIVATLLTPHWKALGLMSGLCAGALYYTRTPWQRLLRNMLYISWLLLFTVLVNIWGQYHTDPSLTDALMQGGLAGGRLLGMVAWATILGTVMSPFVLVAALESLFRPLERLGVPLRTLSVVAMISLRFLPILHQEQQIVIRAHIARGIDLESGGFVQRLKLYILASVPVLTSMLRRVEYLATAMESRAFQVHESRTTLLEFRWRVYDYVLMGGALGIVIVQLF
jgi:energy-coupling factor transport system permease protein